MNFYSSGYTCRRRREEERTIMTDPLDDLKHAQSGDIILSLGSHRISNLIAKLSKEEGGGIWSHASILLTKDPFPTVIEATPPRVRVTPLQRVQDGAVKMRLLHAVDPDVTQEKRADICRYALDLCGARYGFQDFPGLMLDFITGTDWAGNHLTFSQDVMVCSVLCCVSWARAGFTFEADPNGMTPNEIDAYAARNPHKWLTVEIKD
jgi:hypothetical protein